MEKVHNLYFCTHCGFKLTGQEYICPGCGFKIAEAPVPETPVPPKADNPPVTEPVKDVKPVQPVTVNKPFYPEKTKKKKTKKGLSIVWLILIIFFGTVIIGGGTVVFLQYNGNISIALLKDYIPSKSTKQTSDTTKQKNAVVKNNQDMQQKNDSASTMRNNTNPSDKNNMNQNYKGSTASNNGMKYFIIAGSYSTEQLAQEAVGNLKSKGYPDAQVVGQNESGNWRICYKAYSTQQEAMQDLGNIRQKDNPSAWIFELK